MQGRLSIAASFFLLSCRVVVTEEFTPDEKTLLQDFFLGSIDLDKVELQIAYGTDGSYAIGNKITMSGSLYSFRGEPLWHLFLVHEAVHVWQYQHQPGRFFVGGSSDWVENKIREGSYPAYHYTLMPERSLSDYEIEEQAELLSNYFMRLYWDMDAPSIAMADDYLLVGREQADAISESRRQELLE
jgi:hypothetical protein